MGRALDPSALAGDPLGMPAGDRIWLPLALLLGAATGQDAAPTAAPLPLIATAEQRLAKGLTEDAALLLWEAEALVADLAPGVGRDAALSSLRELLPKADPLHAERVGLGAMAGKRLLELAAAYKQKKWFALATDRLRAAAKYDLASAERELLMLPSVTQPAPAARAATTVEPRSLLPAAAVAAASPGWSKQAEAIVAPGTIAASASAFYLLAEQHADHELRVEVQIGLGRGGGGLLFGAATAADCYLLGVYQHEDRGVSLMLSRSAGAASGDLGQSDGQNRVGTGFHTLVVRLRGAELEAELDGDTALRVTLPGPARGKFGLFASGGWPSKQPLVFRNLTLAALSAVATKAAPEVDLQAAIFGDVQQAERLLADKQTEAGIVLLRDAWARVPRLPTGVLRDSLDRSIAAQLLKVDPVHARRTKVAADVAAALVALAERHRQSGRLLCARNLLLQAGDQDRKGSAVALDAVLAELAASEAKLKAERQHELLPPKLAGDLIGDWFGGGQPLHHRDRSWNVTPEAAVAQLTDARWTGLLPRQERIGGKLRVQVQLPRSQARAGFLFDARGSNDCSFCCLARSKDTLALEVHRYQLGKWQRLAQRAVPLPAWRLDGWLPLAMDASVAGLRAKSLDVEVFVERNKLGALGPVGLGASDPADSAVAIDIRGLALVQ